jgi:hypothetical protein
MERFIVFKRDIKMVDDERLNTKLKLLMAARLLLEAIQPAYAEFVIDEHLASAADLLHIAQNLE